MITFRDASLGEEIEYYLNQKTEPAISRPRTHSIYTERGIVIGKSVDYVMVGFMLQPRLGKSFPISQFNWECHPDMKFVLDVKTYPHYVFVKCCYELHTIIGTIRASRDLSTGTSAPVKPYFDDAKFFSSVLEGNCACNIPKQ